MTSNAVRAAGSRSNTIRMSSRNRRNIRAYPPITHRCDGSFGARQGAASAVYFWHVCVWFCCFVFFVVLFCLVVFFLVLCCVACCCLVFFFFFFLRLVWC